MTNPVEKNTVGKLCDKEYAANPPQARLRIALAQINPHVGHLEKNLAAHLQVIKTACEKHQAELIVFPELSLCGYPPEDLLLRSHFIHKVEDTVIALAKAIPPDIYCVIGHPVLAKGKIYNTLSVLHQGKVAGQYHKQCLPNYGVFDEERYFSHGSDSFVMTIKDIPIGFIVCEDVWHLKPVPDAVNAGAKLIVCINASPFELDKHEQRQTLLRKRAIEHHIPLIYVNMVGGQDDLIFDGGSMVMNSDGNPTTLLPFFEERITLTEASLHDDHITLTETPHSAPPTLARAYGALILATRDYLQKNNITHVYIGVSGGIDSALTLTLAVDAIGKENVNAVFLPSRYSSVLSLDEAKAIAENLGVNEITIDIEPTVSTLTKSLGEHIKTDSPSITLQNIQARARAIILMALANETNGLVLTTGNRSEIAVGYCTIYGDMAGGFAPLKDVPKTMVYALSHFRNQHEPVIPEATLTRAPTAELAPNQTDQDTLPPYELLDAILYAHLNQGMGIQAMIESGLPKEAVEKTVKMVKQNEYKRKQAAIGPRLNHSAFGKDWRYPVTNGFVDKA